MKKTVLLFVVCFLLLVQVAYPGKIEVEPNLFQQAINFLNTSADFDTMVLVTSGGVYTTRDTLEYEIIRPMTILAAEGLAEKPIITHSDDSTSVIRMFHCFNSLTIEGVVIDGGHEQSHGLKHGITVIPDPNGRHSIKKGLNLTFRNVDFINFFEDKDPTKEGHALYFYRDIPQVGTVKFENCSFKNIMDEAIRMTETEKYATERVVDSLIVRDCTFENIDSECVRFYADTDTSTTDAVVIVENCTVNNSAPRFCYIKNNFGTQVRNIIVTNGRLSVRRPDRNDYVVEVQGRGSLVTNCDTLNLTFDPNAKRPDVFRGSKGGSVNNDLIWGFDPLFADPANGDFTLAPNSHAFYSGHDGGALGDRRWATATPTVIPFNVTIEGNGSVTYDPPKQGNCYDGGAHVTMTAVPDSGWTFAGWSGDVSGADLTVSVTVNAPTAITATFTQGATAVERTGAAPYDYELGQNYPNPFNPTTSIPFTLKREGRARLEIIDVLGRTVAVVFDRQYKAGSHRVVWDATNFAAGLYFYRLTTPEFTAINKMLYVK